MTDTQLSHYHLMGNVKHVPLTLFLTVVGVLAVCSQADTNTLAEKCFSSFQFTSEGGSLNVNGLPFTLKGASWFGYETSNNVFHGLWARDYRDLLDFLASNGFNAIRVPFYLELVLNDATPNSINFYNMNADLQGLSSLQVLDKVVQAAAEKGLLIMFDLHSFLPGTFMQDGLWYDTAHPEPVILKAWNVLINRYAKQWNVIAFDLKNEPWKTTWGGDASTDWHAAAERIGNYILATPGGDRWTFSNRPHLRWPVLISQQNSSYRPRQLRARVDAACQSADAPNWVFPYQAS